MKYIQRKKSNLLKFFISLSLFALAFLFSTKIFDYKKIRGIATNISPSEIISLTNLARIHYKVPTLEPSEKLMVAAQKKAKDMVSNQYFDHIDKEGQGPWKFLQESDYVYHFAGENLARNFKYSEDVVDGWIKSPEHFENLTSSQYTQVGVAIEESSDGVVVVQILASPIDQKIINNLEDDLDTRYKSTKMIIGKIRGESKNYILSSAIFMAVALALLGGLHIYKIIDKNKTLSPHIKHWKK